LEIQLFEAIAKYRLVIGFLGEREQYGWWQSSFFTQGSDAFLSPLFSRTKILAKCNGVTRAAALVHDERIGIGHVYHLFRLPEDVEQGLHQALHDPILGEALQKVTASPEVALEYLHIQRGTKAPADVGPTRVGNIDALRDQNTWYVVAGLYYQAFTTEEMIFPYFTDLSK
jgi:hypothetical protein